MYTLRAHSHCTLSVLTLQCTVHTLSAQCTLSVHIERLLVFCGVGLADDRSALCACACVRCEQTAGALRLLESFDAEDSHQQGSSATPSLDGVAASDMLLSPQKSAASDINEAGQFCAPHPGPRLHPPSAAAPVVWRQKSSIVSGTVSCQEQYPIWCQEQYRARNSFPYGAIRNTF